LNNLIARFFSSELCQIERAHNKDLFHHELLAVPNVDATLWMTDFLPLQIEGARVDGRRGREQGGVDACGIAEHHLVESHSVALNEEAFSDGLVIDVLAKGDC
jgi:hypothetical protein